MSAVSAMQLLFDKSGQRDTGNTEMRAASTMAVQA
jgi:hypothetical protein